MGGDWRAKEIADGGYVPELRRFVRCDRKFDRNNITNHPHYRRIPNRRLHRAFVGRDDGTRKWIVLFAVV